MSSNCAVNENHCKMIFEETECSDGMCCFTCVIPPGNKHISFFKSLWKKGTGFPHVKLLVTSEGYKNELYDSCRFLDFMISRTSGDSNLKMDLRCSIYKSRPRQCKEYPDKAGVSLYQKISGPCIFNEYAAPDPYKKLVYKRDWQAFFAIRDHVDVIRNVFAHEDARSARELMLKAKGVHSAAISEGTEELEYILIPISKHTQNILYVSDKHGLITTIREAYQRWQEKIEKNLQDHYGPEWETKLKNAIEMEENDASKRCDEDTAGNIEC